MPHSPAPQATAFAHAVTRVALRADAAGTRASGAGIAALILTLLLRLLARTEAAWDILPEDTEEFEYADEYAYTPRALRMPTMGSAPHADNVESGLVPDWVLAGVRNRGMRPATAPARLRRRARPARAPPVSAISCAEITLWLGGVDSRLLSFRFHIIFYIQRETSRRPQRQKDTKEEAKARTPGIIRYVCSKPELESFRSIFASAL